MRTSILAGIALCQIGEFSFVLSQTGLDFNLMPNDVYQTFLAVTVLTMAATPFLINASPHFARVAQLPVPSPLPSQPSTALPAMEGLKDHLIIIGFGVNGRNLARAARAAGIKYVILEMNPDTVRTESKKGEPIFYGDAMQKSVLEHIAVKNARVMVIAISDPIATRRTSELARQMNSNLYIIARTRFVQEVKPLYRLGANEVIPEEFETSVEIFTRVLRKYLVPQEDIERFIAEVRSDNYEMFRSRSIPSATLSDLKQELADVEINTLRVGEKSNAAGKTLGELNLRKKYGVTLLVIRRRGEILANPDGQTSLCPEDQLIILGRPDQIAEASAIFS